MNRRTPIVAALVAALLVVALPDVVRSQIEAEHKASLQVAVDRTAYEAGSQAEITAIVDIDDHWHVNSNTPSYEYLIPTELEVAVPDGWPEPRVSYPEHSLQSFSFTTEPIAVYDGQIVLRAVVSIPPDAEDGAVSVPVSLHYQACDDKQCLPPVREETTLELVIGPGGVPTAGALEPAAPAPREDGRGILLILGLSLLGGAILNVMPCVLPVLSLKVFGLVRSAEEGRAQVTLGALATTAGILVSFWALAGAAIAARSAGAAVGWGVQFQQPGFVAFLAVVVVLFSLNLWGLFEIQLPQFLSRAAGASAREGVAGHFASGLFATLMATPCSAPFLGTAVGFALVQPPLVILAVFTAIGLGMSFPYLLLAVAPGAAKVFPRPGAWMATLRSVLGFLLAAAAIWLFYVLAAQIAPERVAYVQLALLVLALCGWFLGKATGSGGRRLALVGILGASILTVVLAVGSPATSRGSSPDADGRIAWIPFDEANAETRAADGELVFVDFTADWCFTCKTIERLVIDTDPVAEAFERHDVVPMKADWTNADAEITRVLASFGRSAVPFYLLYRPGAEPHVFGEVLTQKALIRALDESAAGPDAAPGDPS